MGNCRDCKHWLETPHPDSAHSATALELSRSRRLRFCDVFVCGVHEMFNIADDEATGITICTAPDFGCVLFSPPVFLVEDAQLGYSVRIVTGRFELSRDQMLIAQRLAEAYERSLEEYVQWCLEEVGWDSEEIFSELNEATMTYVASRCVERALTALRCDAEIDSVDDISEQFSEHDIDVQVISAAWEKARCGDLAGCRADIAGLGKIWEEEEQLAAAAGEKPKDAT